MIEYKDIYEAFEGDEDILSYFDPLSGATSIDEVSTIVYDKIQEYEMLYNCTFIKNDIGYIFYAPEILISFCVKKHLRTIENLIAFWNQIKQLLGKHFKCHLYTKNSRGINWLTKCGMRIENKDELTTLLII